MIRQIATQIADYLLGPLVRQSGGLGVSGVEQRALSIAYRQLFGSKGPALKFKDVDFRIYSQNEEDGILLYIFSLIGTTNKQCVEICAGDGIECNTANLLINHRWVGLLCDGNERNTAEAAKFYKKHPDTMYWPPTILTEWITKDNVNGIIDKGGFAGEVDLLSLDIDGNDYWVWKEISKISPRVVVLEFNHLWGPDVAVTVPYHENFVAEFTEFGSVYAGASLQAFVKLAEQKGYTLIGTNAIATNAFFLRDDIQCEWLPKVDPSVCFDHPRARFGMSTCLPLVKDREWVTV